MPKFAINLNRMITCSESAVLYVEADSLDEARKIARKKVGEYDLDDIHYGELGDTESTTEWVLDYDEEES